MGSMKAASIFLLDTKTKAYRPDGYLSNAIATVPLAPINP
jgi:hypothetical protein